MHVAPLQVFNDADFDRLCIGEFHDAHGDVFEFGQLRRAVAPRPGHDLIGVLADGPHKQGREHSLCADGLGQLVERRFLEAAARVGCRLGEAEKRQVAILRLRLNCGGHGKTSFWVGRA
jgi:hypothetical protein